MQPPPEENLTSELPIPIDRNPVGNSNNHEVNEQSLEKQEVNNDDKRQQVEQQQQLQWPLVQPMQPIPLPPRANLHQKCPNHFVETPYVDVVSFSHYSIRAFMLVVIITLLLHSISVNVLS